MRTLNELFKNNSVPWHYRSDYLLELVIRTQVAVAHRNLFPIHFWKFLKEESGQESVYRESGYLKRKYSSPISVYFYVKDNSPKRALTRIGVEDEIEHDFSVDLGECIRLGEVFSSSDNKLDFNFYLPRSGDIYQWNNTLYEVHDVAPDVYYEPLARYVVWKGFATQLRGDSTDPNVPLSVMKERPKVEHPLWLR